MIHEHSSAPRQRFIAHADRLAVGRTVDDNRRYPPAGRRAARLFGRYAKGWPARRPPASPFWTILLLGCAVAVFVGAIIAIVVRIVEVLS